MESTVRVENDVQSSPAHIGDDRSAYSLGWRGQMLVVLFGLTMLLANLSVGRSMTYHEAIYSQPAREMLASGDWLIPRIAGVPFVEKPPLTTWLVACSIWLFGSSVEWAARLPSVVSALLVAWMISRTTARWFGARIGLMAGFVQLTSYYVLQMATLAEPDIHLIACVTAAMCVFAWSRIESPAGRWDSRWAPIAFFALAGLSFLVKGPIGSIFIFGGCGLFALVHRDWATVRWFFHPLGVVVYLAMFVPYCVAAYLRYPQFVDVWLLHNFGRFSGQMGAGPEVNQSRFYYAYMMPAILLPWLPSLIWGLATDSKLRTHVWTRFAVCWMLPGLSLLAMAKFQSKHYLSPLLPGLSVLTAAGMWSFLSWRANVKNLASWAWALGFALVFGAAAWGLMKRNPLGVQAFLAVLGVCFAFFLLLLWTELRRNAGLQAAVWFAGAGAIIVLGYQLVMPSHDSYRAQSEFARETNRLVPEDQTVTLVGLYESQIPYYMRLTAARVDDYDKFLRELPDRTKSPMHVIVERFRAEQLEKMGEATELARCEKTLFWQRPDQQLVLLRWERSRREVQATPTSRKKE